MKITLYDTTLRDGTQGEGISLSVNDKLRLAQRMDQFGFHYIEGGWPGSNPKDAEFFQRARKLKFKNAKLAAFGSTRRADLSASEDPNLKALLKAETKVVTIFGKSWDLHVKEVFNIPLEKNLEMIRDSVQFLKKEGREVIYDAEHFFDGYRQNAEYARSTLKAAQEAGADLICLCDTNGGMITAWITEIVSGVKRHISKPLGIHVHNDSDMAVANSIAAVEAGCSQVQGTINGVGERCGNANLVSVIANLKLKLGVDCLPDEKLKQLTELSYFVSEICNLKHPNSLPYVGGSAFAHKGGVHIDAVRKNPQTYEHIHPDKVGNSRRVLISELAGRTSITLKAKELSLDLQKKDPKTQKILKLIQKLENEGYQFEAAEASFELLVRKTVKKYKPFFELKGFRVVIDRSNAKLTCEASIKIKVDGIEEHTAAEGDGPVNALDQALRKALERFYPSLSKMRLTDFKVRVLDEKAGTAAKVRVLIQSQDEKDSWGTVGVSENVIEASWQALVDSVEYKLLKDQKK